MKKTITVVAAAVAGLFCLILILGAFPHNQARPADAGTRPFHAVISATTTAQLSGCTLTNDETGSGMAIHLGPITWSDHEVGTFVPCPSGNVEITGDFTITAANGDEIHGEFHTQVTVDPATGDVSIYGPYTFKSGTGRFTNVTGSGIISGYGSVVTQEAAGVMNGFMNYGGPRT